jgi:hypothetical protein
MAEILNFALVGSAPAKVRSAGVPAQFQDAVDRHQKNLIALSAALKAAGITPVAAAGYVDAALASFQNGLTAAVAGQEEVSRG